RIVREVLTVLPDPVGIDGGHPPRCSGGDVGEHGQGNIEVVVRMRTPGQAPVVAHLRHAYGTRHGPEVRVGQWNVHRLQGDGVAHLPPVGGDHVGRGGQTGGTAELG